MSRMVRSAVVAAATFCMVGLAGCAASTPDIVSAPAKVRQVTESSHCGLTGPGLLLVTSDTQLSKYLGLPAQNLATQQLRNVDLEREFLLFVTLGKKSTSGYGVRLTSAEIHGDVLDIRAEVRSPPKDAILAQVMTSPCAVLAVEPGNWNAIRVTGVSDSPLLLRP